MKSIHKYLIILSVSLIGCVIIALFKGDFQLTFINTLFYLSIILCVISGFRFMYERGAFRFSGYSFYKVGKSLGIGGPSKKEKYIQAVEKDSPQIEEDTDDDKQIDAFILGDIPKWGITPQLFLVGITCFILSILLSL